VAALRRLRCRWPLVLSLALLGWAGTGAAQVIPPPVKSVDLKNGLRVLLAPDTLAAAVDVAVWYRAGTRYEPAGMSGITHLMERWMFRGSKGVAAGEHRRLVQAEGGTASTYTTSDASSYFDTVPAEALEMALKLEAGRMGTIPLTAEGLERERRVVREERAQLARGGPLRLGLERLYAIAFPGHPYGWPATGLERDLEKVTLAACESYQRAQYSPDNAIVVVTGRFDPAQALSLVRRHFGSLPPPSSPATRPPTLAVQLAEQRAEDRIEGEIPLLLVGWRAPGGADKSAVALDVLSRLLARGGRSRLGRELMRPPMRGLGVEGGFDARRDASLLYAAVVVRPSADRAEVESAFHAECDKLASQPPDVAELDAVKREAELEMLIEWETVRGLGQSLGMAEAVYGDHRVATERLQRLRDLTPDDVMRVAAETLKAERRNVVWLVPAGGAGGREGGGR
jgi:zinc protease